VDHTEQVCRDLCAFLAVPYDAQMLKLNQADLSAVFKAPHHAYLRRGIIERQKYAQELVPPAVVKKLERFRHRWQPQTGEEAKPASAPPAGPGPVEFFYHNAAGKMLILFDSLVRAGFEFLPLAWLRIYRLLKTWVVNPPSGESDEKMSLLKDCQKHGLTILSATVLMGLIVFIHLHSNPHLMFILFYAVPCALLALVVNNRWATLFVLASSIVAPSIQFGADADYQSAMVFVWNFFSRFILLEILVLTIGRIRLEFSKTGDQVS
jgi:hypothetical protein